VGVTHWLLLAPLGAIALVVGGFMNSAVAEAVIAVAARLYSADPQVRAEKQEEWLRLVRDMNPIERPAHAGSLLWRGVQRRMQRRAGTVVPEQPVFDRVEPTPRELGFRGPQVCSVVGITYRQLDYWARTDLVRPSIADAKGNGTQRTYSFQDLVRLKVVKSLLDAGVKLQTARQAIGYLREDLGDDWAKANLVLDGTNAVLVRTDDMLIDVVRNGQGVLNIVPLAQVMEVLDAGVREHVVEQRNASED
jgi:DNA-binding transcriptional MerR regulator